MSARNMEEIAEVFKNLSFRRTLFDGVDEKDVWKKLEQVQREYRSAYECQQAAYEARLRERDGLIARLRGETAEAPSAHAGTQDGGAEDGAKA